MRTATTGSRGGRPMVMATRGVVSSGHYLATAAGLEILRKGGNAMDAAAAVGFALAVLKPHQNGIGGEVPIIGFDARSRQPFSISGNGTSPRTATIGFFRSLGLSLIPGEGFLPAIVPPAVATWVLLLARYGTMRLTDVLTPAIEYAESGLPMYDSLQAAIAGSAERFRSEWPSSAETFLPDDKVSPIGTLWRQPDLGDTFKKLLDAEHQHSDRENGLIAARERFYRGNIAEGIVRFACSTRCRDETGTFHTGLLSLEDLAAMGHNTAAYVHTVTEALKLALADREFYYGDPKFAEVPLSLLLDKSYAAERRALIDEHQASMLLRPGNQQALRAESIESINRCFDPQFGDTTKLEVIDAQGNMVSATPSGGWLMSSPVIASYGFPLGTRGQMFSLVPNHPNALRPGKRPRTTLTPSFAMQGGRPWMVFGSPGGDMQDQWALEFFLNVVEFGMSLQEAVEAATFWTSHAPSSFYPRQAEPGVLYTEERINGQIVSDLQSRGHIVRVAPDWSGGNALAACMTGEGVLCAAASPRLDPAYAGGF